MCNFCHIHGKLYHNLSPIAIEGRSINIFETQTKNRRSRYEISIIILYLFASPHDLCFCNKVAEALALVGKSHYKLYLYYDVCQISHNKAADRCPRSRFGADDRKSADQLAEASAIENAILEEAIYGRPKDPQKEFK